jgi:hypothetical protein
MRRPLGGLTPLVLRGVGPLWCTVGFRSCLRGLPGFFVVRSCDHSVQTLSARQKRELAVTPAPTPWVAAARPAVGACVVRSPPESSPRPPGRPHPPSGPQPAVADAGILLPLCNVRDYNHRHLAGMPARSRSPYGSWVVVGKTAPPDRWGFSHARTSPTNPYRDVRMPESAFQLPPVTDQAESVHQRP